MSKYEQMEIGRGGAKQESRCSLQEKSGLLLGLAFTMLALARTTS